MNAPIWRDENQPLFGAQREWAQFVIKNFHYARSVPAGKSHYFCCNGVFFCFSIPANKNIARYLLGENATSPSCVWELSRMWCADGHAKNALTQGLSAAVSAFHAIEPGVVALVSYADPNVGHKGFVYRAASWVPVGQCEESRYYRSADGQVVSRRKFHSGSRSLRKAEIEAMGYVECKLPGKYRFAKGLTKKFRKIVNRRAISAIA